MKLAIITTHPIQYNAPLFRLLNQRGNIQIRVFYTWGKQVAEEKYDPGFGKNIEWDVPLLEGYEYEWAENVSLDPGSHHFNGIHNPGLVGSIESWHADAVLVYGWSFKSHLKVMRHFHGKIPVFFRGDSIVLSTGNSLKNKFKSMFLKWGYSHVDKALFVGTRNKEYYLKYGLWADQLVFCPHAIDNDRFMEDTINSAKAAKWKLELNVPLGSTGFLYAGKLDDNKNVRLLLEAFVKATGENYLIVAGNGVLENDFIKLYSSCNNIFFLPFQNQQMMPVVYRMADVFVLPSKTETWGLGINEAMACGRAVLVSDNCGAAPDLVEEGRNGFTFKSGNCDDLMEKIIKITNDKEALIKMQKKSIDKIQNWNYEKDCIAIESLLNKN
jgi:glycosyltransferase involved in cell wall biosynthesis